MIVQKVLIDLSKVETMRVYDDCNVELQFASGNQADVGFCD